MARQWCMLKRDGNFSYDGYRDNVGSLGTTPIIIIITITIWILDRSSFGIPSLLVWTAWIPTIFSLIGGMSNVLTCVSL